MTARSLLLRLIVLALALPGCGYQLYHYPSDRSEALGVVVETLQNDSFDPGYEFMIGDAMRREFARRGALRIVDDPSRAEWVLRGRILPINTSRQSFSSVVLTLEYEVDVSLELEVLRAPRDETGEPTGLGVGARVLRQGDLYLASADVEATRKNRQEALRRVAMVLATRIHDVLYEMDPPVEIEPAAYEFGTDREEPVLPPRTVEEELAGDDAGDAGMPEPIADEAP